jgi:hypothetical protein
MQKIKLMKVKTFFWLLIVLALGMALATCTPAPTPTPTVVPPTPSAQATLLTYNTVERLLAGDLLHTTTVDKVQRHLADYPPDWPVVGVGTTDWIGRNGELMPDGTTSDLHFWWADPNSLTQADVKDMADPNVTTSLGRDVRFPFLGLAIGDPETATTWTLQDVENVHAWLEEKLDASDIDLAGVQLRGQFGLVKTTVAYNIPLTGLDLSGGYVGEDHFRFGEYITATWTMNGLYAADPAMQTVISTPGHPLHLHGYQPETMLGGHVGSASAISVTATVWPLSQVITQSVEITSESTKDSMAFDFIIAPDIAERIAQLQPIDMSQTLDLDDLEDWEVAVLDKLIQAAAYMDAAYWQQVDPEGAVLYQKLAGTTDPQLQDARFLMGVHFGRWDSFGEFEPFIGTAPRPDGAWFYPPDLTREELDRYIAEHPDEKDALLSPFTVVRRQGDRLVAIPYHQTYAPFVLPAADLLEQATDLARNESLKTYLTLQAQALRTDDYYEANLAWLDLDSRLDFIIAPHEVYDDQLTGQKTAYEGIVMVVDRVASAALVQFKDAIPALQANLPVPAEYKPDQTGTLTPIMEIAQNVYSTGFWRAGNQYAAVSLPNDPRVWEAKGVKKVMMQNLVEARQQTVLTPLAGAVLDEEAARLMNPDAFLDWLLMHEVSHSLGPCTVQRDGEELTVRQALGEYYAPIEEGKADIVGLYNLVYLHDQGLVTGSLESHYVGYLSEALRAVRFGSKSAYGLIRSAAWNYYVKQGALRFDATSGRFSLDADEMSQAVEELATRLLTIEGQGDTEAAADFLDQYAHRVRPPLHGAPGRPPRRCRYRRSGFARPLRPNAVAGGHQRALDQRAGSAGQADPGQRLHGGDLLAPAIGGRSRAARPVGAVRRSRRPGPGPPAAPERWPLRHPER